MTKKNIDQSHLYEVYKEKKSLEETCKVFGITRQTAANKLRRAGFIVNRRPKKYSCDDAFFSQDTPESFYWAGFIAADGCIKKSRGNTQLKIEISVYDLVHLKKFVSAIKFTGKIENVKWRSTNGVVARITSKQIAQDLERFNIVPRKTLIYTFPEWLINHPMVNHFMRGYFDGDGSVWFYLPKLNKTQVLAFEMLGTENFVNTYADILKEKCDVNTNIRKKENIWKGRFSGNQAAQRVREFLYKDATDDILLERKRDRFFDPEVDTNRRKRKIIGTSLKDGSQLTFDSIADAVKEGFDSHIVCCLNGRRKHNKNYTWKYIE
jgi:hypothetical protein